MAQTVPPITTTESGTQLATDINNIAASLLSSNSGTTRPSYVVAGTCWLNSTTNQLFFYDGAQDILLYTIDSTNHLLNPPVGGGTATLASASTVDLASVAPPCVTITGTTAITGFGANMKAGQIKFLTFAAALTLTNSASLLLPGGANITTAAGDVAMIECVTAGNYKCLMYMPVAGYESQAKGLGYTGFRNRIINGDMRIDQANEGAAQTIIAAAAAAYTVDQFYAKSTGANVTGQRVAGSGADQYLYQFTGAASVTGITFGTPIEATNIYDLANTTATFSVELANSLLTTVTWTAYAGNASDTFTSKTTIATGTFTVNSTLAKYSAQIALPAGAQNGVEIELSVGAQTSGTWKIGEMQFETGTVVTAFDRLPMDKALSACEWYFRKSYDLGVKPGTASTNGAFCFRSNSFNSMTGLSTYMSVPFQSKMRTSPTVTLYSPSTGASGKIRDEQNNLDLTPTVYYSGMGAFSWQAQSTTNTTAVQWSGQYTANARITP